jgi:transcriptional regulator with XRE-family HTH domain
MSLGDLVARNIRAERSRHRWRQVDLAKRLGASQTTVSDLESGRRRVDIEQMVRLCEALQVPMLILLNGASAGQLRVLGLLEQRVGQPPDQR